LDQKGKKGQETGENSTLHNEQLQHAASPSIISIMKSRRMSRIGNLICIGEKRNAYTIFVGK
jgi:hypothetical protein